MVGLEDFSRGGRVGTDALHSYVHASVVLIFVFFAVLVFIVAVAILRLVFVVEVVLADLILVAGAETAFK